MCNVINILSLDLYNFSIKNLYFTFAPFLSQIFYILQISNLINYKTFINKNLYNIINFIIDMLSLFGIFGNILNNIHVKYSKLVLLIVLQIFIIIIIPYIVFFLFLRQDNFINLFIGLGLLYLQIILFKIFYCMFNISKIDKIKLTKKISDNKLNLNVVKPKILNLPEFINLDISDSKIIDLEIEGSDINIDLETKQDNIQIYPNWINIDKVNKRINIEKSDITGTFNVKIIVNFDKYNEELEFALIRSNKKPKIKILNDIEFFEDQYFEFDIQLEDDSPDDVSIDVKLYKNNIILDPSWFIFDKTSNKVIFDKVPTNYTGNYNIYIDIIDNKDNIRFLEIVNVIVKKNDVIVQ
jgi:hypothetical protein